MRNKKERLRGYKFDHNSSNNPVDIYVLKVNNKDTKQRHWCRSGAFIVNFEQVSHLALVFLLITLNM